MSRDINPFGLRMPIELRERLEGASSESGRSLNAEIVQRLERSFDQSDDVVDTLHLGKLVEEIALVENGRDRYAAALSTLLDMQRQNKAKGKGPGFVRPVWAPLDATLEETIWLGQQLVAEAERDLRELRDDLQQIAKARVR